MSDELPPPEPASAPDREDERASRRTTVLILAAAAVVLAAIGLGIYLIATAGKADEAGEVDQPTITAAPQPEPSSPAPLPSDPPLSAPATSPAPPPPNRNVVAARTAAEQAAMAINERDATAMQQLSCDPGAVDSVEAFPPGATARLAGIPQVSGNKATARIELSISGTEPTVVPLPMERRDGRWCVP